MTRQVSRRKSVQRRGVTVPTVVFIMIAMLGFLAFSFDLGRVALVRAQMQNAADASALAGASGLATDNLILSNFNQSADLTTATTLSQTFAQANKYDLNASRSVVFNTNTDITFGYLSNPSNLGSALNTTETTSPKNSVQVNTYVNSTHGGSLSYFFAPVLSQSATGVTATATATVQLYKVGTMKAISGYRAQILPITMSYSDWLAMVNKQTGNDNYSYDPSTNTITSGSDGLYEQQLYPGSNVTSSNNGLIQFGTGSRSNSILQDQIVNGPTYDQMMAQWPPSGSPPWNAQNQFTIGADPGWRANSFTDLQTVADSGDVRLIPINNGVSPGNGANGTYTIVALAPIRVMYSNKGGKSGGYAMVQPAVINDPTVVPSTTLAGSGQGGVAVYRLSR
jgi:Flp pilus assembly protein TadG